MQCHANYANLGNGREQLTHPPKRCSRELGVQPVLMNPNPKVQSAQECLALRLAARRLAKVCSLNGKGR